MQRVTWGQYAKKFTTAAVASGYTPDEIHTLLEYAGNLFKQGFPIIFDQTHLSLLVGYRIEYLRKVSNAPSFFYRTFEIPKKNGGRREISEPLPSLKEVQRWILDNILYNIEVSKYAKAFHKKRSIRSNAWFHLKKNIVLRIDITDFFGSIKFSKVYGVFSSMGYSTSVATMLANLCTLNNKLPQGAPTSPALSNIVFIAADKRISKFASAKHIRYTRYADDLTFSGDFQPGMVVKFVRSVLEEYQFKINPKKTRVQRKQQRQLVTGVVVNEKMQAPREMRRKLRQSVYYIQKYGLPSHLKKTENDKANHIRHLLGIANFILFINPEDQEVKTYARLLSQYLE